MTSLVHGFTTCICNDELVNPWGLPILQSRLILCTLLYRTHAWTWLIMSISYEYYEQKIRERWAFTCNWVYPAGSSDVRTSDLWELSQFKVTPIKTSGETDNHTQITPCWKTALTVGLCSCKTHCRTLWSLKQNLWRAPPGTDNHCL